MCASGDTSHPIPGPVPTNVVGGVVFPAIALPMHIVDYPGLWAYGPSGLRHGNPEAPIIFNSQLSIFNFKHAFS